MGSHMQSLSTYFYVCEFHGEIKVFFTKIPSENALMIYIKLYNQNFYVRCGWVNFQLFESKDVVQITV